MHGNLSWIGHPCTAFSVEHAIGSGNVFRQLSFLFAFVRLVKQALAFLQVRIMLSVLQFRLNRRYVEAQPPFIAIELDQSDSGREGCAVSTLTITSEPKDWRGAIQVLRALLTLAHISHPVKDLWQLTQ